MLDYVWGASARSLLIAAAKAGSEGKAMRFVQIGAISGREIAVPAAVLRSSAIEMMGSGFGSIRFERLTVAIQGVLQAARRAGLTLEYRCVPLSEIDATWGEPDAGRRIIYTTAPSSNKEGTITNLGLTHKFLVITGMIGAQNFAAFGAGLSVGMLLSWIKLPLPRRRH